MVIVMGCHKPNPAKYLVNSFNIYHQLVGNIVCRLFGSVQGVQSEFITAFCWKDLPTAAETGIEERLDPTGHQTKSMSLKSLKSAKLGAKYVCLHHSEQHLSRYT